MHTTPIADRLKRLPRYVFIEVAEKREKYRAEGRKIIDLSIGDPDLPTPPVIVECLREAAQHSPFHRYPQGIGSIDFREAASRFYKRRFGVELDPHSEITALIGSKEGLGHLPLALLNPNDIALVPDPAYPVYAASVGFAEGHVTYMPLLAKNRFLPDLDAIDKDILKKTKLLFINYPNNPTGATAPREFYEHICILARQYGFVICQDNAYSDIYFSEEPPLSILNIENARDVAVEFYSLSKTFNMTGWRIAFAVGQPQVLAALAGLKSNLDSGVFGAIQAAAITALDHYEELHPDILRSYRERRALLMPALERLGWMTNAGEATFYCWAKYPDSISSADFATKLIDECGIIATPGSAFGPAGEGYIRFSLTASTAEIEQTAEILISRYL